MSNLGKEINDLTKEYVQKTKDDLVGIFSKRHTLIALLIISIDSFATFIPLICEDDIQQFLPAVIIQAFFLVLTGILSFFHIRFVRRYQRLYKLTDFIVVFLLLGLTIPKFHAVMESSQLLSTPFVLGLTFMTNYFILDLSATTNRTKMVFTILIGIYALIVSGTNEQIYATPFIQSASFIFAGVWLITIRERVKKSLFNENIFLFEKEKLWQGIVQDFPEWTFLIDGNKNVIFSNSQSHQNTKQVLMRLKTTAGPSGGSPTNNMTKSHETPIRGLTEEKLSKVHHIKEISVTKNEEIAYSFFGPFVEKLSSTYTSKELKADALLMRNASFSQDPVESNDPSKLEKLQIKMMKKWLKGLDLLTVIDLIVENIKTFKNIYPKGCLELCGKISMQHQDQSNSNFFVDKSMEIKISVTQFQEKDSIILVISDITQRDLISRLEGVNEYKINLLASFSHELRTPLNANLNLLETLLEHKDLHVDLKKNYVLPAFRSAKLLFYMISDILDYSQMSLNKISVKVTSFSLHVLIYQITDLFRIQATQKGLKLNVRIKDDMDMKNDPARISQILVTLLSNAVKFTYHGSITVEAIKREGSVLISVTDTGIGLKESAANKLNKLLLLSSDQNLGKIAEESTGASLGLTVASKLAFLVSPQKASGISLTRHREGGSTFSFIIEDRRALMNQKSIIDMSLSVCGTTTLARSNTEKPEELRREKTYFEGTAMTLPEEGMIDSIDNFDIEGGGMFKKGLLIHSQLGDSKKTQPSSSSRDNPKEVSYKDVLKYSYSRQKSIITNMGNCKCEEILVVDDDAFNIIAAQRLLEGQNMKYMCAYNGKQAIETIEAKQRCGDSCKIFKMILMDCNMPVMDGYECTKYLKEKMYNEELPNIPIIACTSFVTHFDAQACFECGMDDYTTKPLSREKFVGICYKWIRRRSLPE